MKTRDLFTMLQEQGATITKPKDPGIFGQLTLSHPSGDTVNIHDWCGRGVYDLIFWCKRHVPGDWHITLTPEEAVHVWGMIKVSDQAVVRANRPADVGDGWMLSLVGVDLYEARLESPEKKAEGANMVFTARALQLQRILLSHAKKDPPEGESARVFRCVGFGPPWEEHS